MLSCPSSVSSGPPRPPPPFLPQRKQHCLSGGPLGKPAAEVRPSSGGGRLKVKSSRPGGCSAGPHAARPEQGHVLPEGTGAYGAGGAGGVGGWGQSHQTEGLRP